MDWENPNPEDAQEDWGRERIKPSTNWFALGKEELDHVALGLWACSVAMQVLSLDDLVRS